MYKIHIPQSRKSKFLKEELETWLSENISKKQSTKDEMVMIVLKGGRKRAWHITMDDYRFYIIFSRTADMIFFKCYWSELFEQVVP